MAAPCPGVYSRPTFPLLLHFVPPVSVQATIPDLAHTRLPAPALPCATRCAATHCRDLFLVVARSGALWLLFLLVGQN